MPLPKQPKVLGDTLKQDNKPNNHKDKIKTTASLLEDTATNTINALDNSYHAVVKVAEEKFSMVNKAVKDKLSNIFSSANTNTNKNTNNKASTSSTLMPQEKIINKINDNQVQEKPSQELKQANINAVTTQKNQHNSSLKNKNSKKNLVLNKMFVLDTNVLLHDPSSLFRFAEHNIYLPMMVLEELDNHKKGLSEVARNARTISRTLDSLLEAKPNIENGIPLNITGHKEATGTLFFQTQDLSAPEIKGFINTKADNYILGVVKALQDSNKFNEVVLVSKDINMRIKANALNIPAEEYFSDHVVDDLDLLYKGYKELPANFWSKHSKNMESWQNPKNGTTFYKVQGALISQFHLNQMVYLAPDDGSLPFYAQVTKLEGKQAELQTLIDYTHKKNNIWGITARNREQNFALNLLMNPDIDFVSLLGQAGTGKTLLALASAIQQVIESKLYNQIIITRATVPLGEDIGFLPGTEEEKMQPWMGALDDNLEVLQQGESSTSNATDWGKDTNLELIRSKIKVKSMSFMRGRTFVRKFLIIDEAQNLTPKQMKALITRAGVGTKIVCMGNIAQIDTPYLTEGSSGLTYVVDRFKGWKHGGHITLARGERSRLAEHAGEVL